MKKILFTFLFLLFLCPALLISQNTGAFNMQFDNEGITSVLSFYVPEDYDSTKSYPMLHGWHGAGMAGTAMRDLLYGLIANERKIIVSCPDANNAQTNNQLNNLINASYGWPIQNYNIDTTKIVITGYSWGGRMCFELGLMNPALFAGIIGLAPALGQLDQTMWDNIDKIKMATIIGTLDFNWEPVNALMLQIQQNGGQLLYLVKEGLEHNLGYANSQDFIDDYVECYNYVLDQSTDVESIPAENPAISINPNPVSDNTSISIKLEKPASVKVRIINLRGEEIYSHVENTFSNDYLLDVDMSIHTPGVYFAFFNIGNRAYFKKIVKAE